MKTNNKWIIVLILVFAAVLRLWNLGNNPPHLSPDEAALGYNAYSILKTGRDEHGKLFPLVFESFGDFKPGLYVYATVPFVAIFGLNEWSVRLPSALSGIVTIYLIYLIIGKLKIKNSKLKILATIIAATNPWLIIFSRGAWEANLSLMLTLLGIYYFLRSRHVTYYLLHASLFFGLTLLTYQGAKLSTAIVLFLLIVVYWSEFWKIPKKYIATSLMIGFIFLIPIMLGILKGQGGRLEVFSVFSYPRSNEYLEAMLDEGQEKTGNLSYYLYHSEQYNFLRGIVGRWFNHFSGKFLFFEGDYSNPRHSSPNHGMFLLSDLVLVLAGLIIIVRNFSSHKKAYSFILLWLIFSPLPSILSRDQVHAVRSLNMVVPIIFILTIGLSNIFKRLRIVSYGFLSFYLLAFIYFCDSYFIHLPIHNAKYWSYGYKQVAEYITPVREKYSKIIVQQSFDQPYIYFLFFGKIDPSKWQKEGVYTHSENVLDVYKVTDIENIHFENIDWSKRRGDRGTVFVSDPEKIHPNDSSDPKQFLILTDIKYPKSLNSAFRIIEVI